MPLSKDDYRRTGAAMVLSGGMAKRTQILGGVLGVLGVAAYFTIGREAEQRYVASSMEDITTKVATDAVAQYEMAKRQGDPIQTCVQAGMVSAAWLQAKKEAQYVAAKAVEKADCGRAGLPQP